LVMQNFPAALIAPVIFMGNLKTEPAVGLDLRDPTFCALIALTLTILVWAARHTLQGDLSQQLRIVFLGQGRAIAAFAAFSGVIALSYTRTIAPDWGGEKLALFVCIGSL